MKGFRACYHAENKVGVHRMVILHGKDYSYDVCDVSNGECVV